MSTKSLGIVCVHLVSGEDIIGDVHVWKGQYVIAKPVLPNVRFDPERNKFHVGLLPLRPYIGATKSVTIKADRVIYVVPVNESLCDLYKSFTVGSGRLIEISTERGS
jgi:hypothetical protein